MTRIKFTNNNLGFFVLGMSLVLGILAFFFGRNVKNLENLGYFGVFLVNLFGSATIVFPIPSFAATIAAGAFLNPFITALFSSAGSTIGELTGYYAGVGGEKVIDVKDKRVAEIEKWMEKYGLWVVFVLAAIPNPLFDIAGMISGASGISIKRYLPVVFGGKMIKFTVLAYSGFETLKLFGITL